MVETATDLIERIRMLLLGGLEAIDEIIDLALELQTELLENCELMINKFKKNTEGLGEDEVERRVKDNDTLKNSIVMCVDSIVYCEEMCFEDDIVDEVEDSIERIESLLGGLYGK